MLLFSFAIFSGKIKELVTMSNEIRTTLGLVSSSYDFKSILRKEGRFTYYFVFDLGDLCIVKHKKIFGLVPSYVDLARFRYINIYKYINAHYDAYGIEINEVLKKDIYLNDEVRLFLIKKLSEVSWDELGVNNFGNYGEDYSASGPDACRRVGMEYRLAELDDRKQNGVSKFDLQPPWAYIKE